MAIFKCPVCKDIHRLNDGYDQMDYDCPKTHLHRRSKFQDMVPEDLLTRSAYNFNTHSTKIDEHRDATIINPEVLKSDENRVTKTKTRRSYNW